MAKPRSIQVTESISDLATEERFRDWTTVYEADENAAVRETLRDPEWPVPGDQLMIPDRTRREENAAAERRTVFITRRRKQTILPVVFIPGMMATRLCATPNASPVWDPDRRRTMAALVARGWMSSDHESIRGRIGGQRRLFLYHRPELDAAKDFAEVLEARNLRLRTESSYVDYQPYNGLLSPTHTFHGQLIRYLATQLGDELQAAVSKDLVVAPYGFGYDWRQSNRLAGERLYRQLLSKFIARGWEFVLITHSMGGLVARSCLAQFPTAVRHCARVIHLSQPVSGSENLYRYFKNGIDPEFGSWALAQIQGTTHHKFVNLASSMPGVFELLPNRAYRTGATDWLTLGRDVPVEKPADPEDLYLERNGITGLITRGEDFQEDWVREHPGRADELEAHLRSALRLHDELGAFSCPERTTTVWSEGPETDHACHVDLLTRRTQSSHYDDFGTPVGCERVVNKWLLDNRHSPFVYEHRIARAVAQRSSRGDGTVPTTSQRALPASQEFKLPTTDVDHGETTEQPATRSLVGQIIQTAAEELLARRRAL